jgi:A/G-specific adenine glycosylase
MLQQTQVDRVIPKYKAFLKAFPTARVLARAALPQVLLLWSGLGYNRRAKYLWEAAKRWGAPLETLPGVGPYTASAVRVFAYNKPEILIETNIRAVFLHHLFPKSKKVPDARLMPFIVRALDRKKPRVWYAALMDYGSYLKKKLPNPSRRSRLHTKQKPFKGSDREIRGGILKAHLAGRPLSKLPFDKVRVLELKKKLKAEGLI